MKWFMHFAGVLQKMTWPPQSPDLNIIEQMWDLLDLKLAKDQRNTPDQMWRRVQEAWAKIRPNEIQKYTDTMPKRCQAVIAAKGGHTKY